MGTDQSLRTIQFQIMWNRLIAVVGNRHRFSFVPLSVPSSESAAISRRRSLIGAAACSRRQSRVLPAT